MAFQFEVSDKEIWAIDKDNTIYVKSEIFDDINRKLMHSLH